MLRLDRYVARTVLLQTGLAISIFALLFGGYSAVLLLGKAVEGELPAGFVVELVGLKLLIALEVLLPIALYLGIVLGLGRLSATSELIAMEAVGYSRRRLLGIVLSLALLFALLTLLLSLFGRPWAYRRSEWLGELARARFDLAKVEARRFFVADGGDLVLFAEEVDRKARRLKGVFFQKAIGEKRHLVYAQAATQLDGGDSSRAARHQRASPAQAAEQLAGGDRLLLRFQGGYAYHLDPEGAPVTVHFGQLDFHLEGGTGFLGYRSKMASLGELWQNRHRPKDLAELEWRLSRPFSALILALLALPLGRYHPRQGGRSGRLIVAVLLFALYYNLAAMAKAWVKEGVVGAFPGLFWPDLLLLLLALYLLRRLR